MVDTKFETVLENKDDNDFHPQPPEIGSSSKTSNNDSTAQGGPRHQNKRKTRKSTPYHRSRNRRRCSSLPDPKTSRTTKLSLPPRKLTREMSHPNVTVDVGIAPNDTREVDWRPFTQ